jgi:hypothetical protein
MADDETATVEALIVDGFTILGQFSGGASSRVHFARNDRTGFICPVKIIDHRAQSDRGFNDILHEVSVFMQVSHSNVWGLFRYESIHSLF